MRIYMKLRQGRRTGYWGRDVSFFYIIWNIDCCWKDFRMKGLDTFMFKYLAVPHSCCRLVLCFQLGDECFPRIAWYLECTLPNFLYILMWYNRKKFRPTFFYCGNASCSIILCLICLTLRNYRSKYLWSPVFKRM